jgi:hypothetical protein
MDMSDPLDRDDLAYVKYSAKELLFHQAQQLTKLQENLSDMKTDTTNQLHEIKIGMQGFVTRQELINTRRWAISAVLASAATGLAMLRFLEV